VARVRCSLFFHYLYLILTGPFIREIPDLPRTASGRSKKKKQNLSKIKGRIMDPVARSAAQRAAKKAAQNEVDVASGKREESEVDMEQELADREREESEVAPGEQEESEVDMERELANRERARPVYETTGSASFPTAERPQCTPAVDAAVRPFFSLNCTSILFLRA
jgi:hypothetical protein